MSSHKKVSLSEINQSIETPNNNHFWQNLKAFLGPGALDFISHCHATSADGRKAWDCNPDGLGSSNGSSFTQMASL